MPRKRGSDVGVWRKKELVVYVERAVHPGCIFTMLGWQYAIIMRGFTCFVFTYFMLNRLEFAQAKSHYFSLD